MSLERTTKVLAPGYAVALCRDCVRAGVPEGSIVGRPWTPYHPDEFACSACAVTFGASDKIYTVHPAGGQKCWMCQERKPGSGFVPYHWRNVTRHAICKACAREWSEGTGANSYAGKRRTGITVTGKGGRVLGRLEAVAPPASDPFAEDNKDVYWRVIYQPEPLPGEPTVKLEVLAEYDGLGITGSVLHIRTWHGHPYQDQAWVWAESYRARWARMHGDEPRPPVELFTRSDVTQRYGERCFYCRQAPFEQLDHYIPVSAGGAHTLENVRPACTVCNQTKRASVPELEPEPSSRDHHGTQEP